MTINVSQTIWTTPTESFPGADYALRRIVKAVNDSQVEIAITLSSGAIVVAGTLISIGAYYDQLSIDLASTLEGDAEMSRVLDDLKEAGNSNSLPCYVHLKGAAIFTANSQSSISKVSLWRGAINSINGYSLG